MANRKNRIILALIVVFLVSFLFFSPWGKDREKSASKYPEHRPNFIFVTMDTLRADHVGSYGYPRDVSPFFDALAGQGVLFENVFSASSHTAPSHATMFTGLYPYQHNVLRNHESLEEHIFNMHNFFSELGYQSAGLPSVAFLEGKMGFPLVPFETSDDEDAAMRRFRYRNAEAMVDRAISWLEQADSSQPVFLWLHFYDIHQWQGRGQLPEEYIAKIEAMHDPDFLSFIEEEHKIPLDFFDGPEGTLYAMDGYDARLLFIDDQLRRLYDHMTNTGFNNDTFWVMTSDHGEGLGNHNYGGHGEFLYNEQLHIPLIFHHTAGTLTIGRVQDLVRTVDFLPTLTELVGVPLRDRNLQIEGVSFLPLLQGRELNEERTRLSFAQRRPKDTESFRRDWLDGEVHSLQDLRAKYIYQSEAEDEFYDLEADPFELENLVNSDRIEEKFLSDTIQGMLAEQDEDSARVNNEPVLTPDQIKELQTLGYL